jgi:tRNA 2-selenouridine synthase
MMMPKPHLLRIRNFGRRRNMTNSKSVMTATKTILVFLAATSTGVTSAFSATTRASSVATTIRPDTEDYRALLLSDAPMMDVRAPVEFSKGSFPSSTNLPLMTNDERHEVGICYKQHGQDAAIELGHSLVTGQVKAQRIKQWTDFLQANPDQGYLYCFRGGLRSNLAQQWIKEETGIHFPLVKGGYKALRNFLLLELEQSLDAQNTDLIVVCGKTGTGKTRVIEQLNHCSVDLEGLAHHRGSTFGQLPEDPGQPSQIDFENNVSIAFLKLLDAAKQDPSSKQKPQVFVEDEGNRIGRVGLPLVLSNRMKACQGIVVIEERMDDRVDVLLEDYVMDLGRRFVALYGNDLGPELHRDFLIDALKRVRNRLGGDRHDQVTGTMAAAFREQQSSQDTGLHRVWITALLEHYYDKMYDYQLAQRNDQVLFHGSREAVTDWATAATASQMMS